MKSQNPRPRLSSAPISRYGRYGKFREFGNMSSEHASIGSKALGKMMVDCEFLFKKSHWGVLGEEEYPAGIIYLNLNFGPPQGCRVKNATVTITLDDNDPSVSRLKYGRDLHKTGCPVQITSWYGPRELGGPMKTANTQTAKKFVPEINVLGNGGGGVGFESKTSFQHQARWSFNGQLLPGRDTWVYKTLRWDLSENELEKQSFHSSTIRTAFAFEHSGQPFLMKVDIDGRLESWNQQVLSKFRFGADCSKGSRITTLLDFEDYTRYTKSLDMLARGLPRAMEMANLEEVPIEIPDVIPGATIRPVVQNLDPVRPEVPSQGAFADGPADSPQVLPGTGHPLLGANAPPVLLSRERAGVSVFDLAGAPTIQDLRSVLEALPQRQGTCIEIIPGLDPEPASSTESTVVESEQENSMPEEGVIKDPEFPKLQDKVDVLELLRTPVIQILLQLLSSMMRLLGYGPSS